MDRSPAAKRKRTNARVETINGYAANAQVRIQILERHVAALGRIIAEISPDHAPLITAIEKYEEEKWQGAPVPKYGEMEWVRKS